jgi:hypothetical protein
MQPKYVTGKNNQAAKLFREDFYATAPMLEMAIMHIHTDLINDGTPDAYITVKMVKRKMHEQLKSKPHHLLRRKRQRSKQINPPCVKHLLPRRTLLSKLHNHCPVTTAG